MLFYFTRDLPTVTQTISQFALNPAFVTLVRFRSRKARDHSNKSAIKEWEFWFWALGCGYAILFNSLLCLNLNLIPASLSIFSCLLWLLSEPKVNLDRLRPLSWKIKKLWSNGFRLILTNVCWPYCSMLEYGILGQLVISESKFLNAYTVLTLSCW